MQAEGLKGSDFFILDIVGLPSSSVTNILLVALMAFTLSFNFLARIPPGVGVGVG